MLNQNLIVRGSPEIMSLRTRPSTAFHVVSGLSRVIETPMGCDIHLLTEYRMTVNDEKKWVNGDHFSYNPYYVEGEDENRMEIEEVYGDRNYQLFARLAGVRKYGETPETIEEPRGVPPDIDTITRLEVEKWDGDGHSHSWFTFKELEEYGERHAWDSITWKDFMSKLEARMRDKLWIFAREISEANKQDFRIVFFFDN